MKISSAKQSRLDSLINELDSEVEVNRFNDAIEEAKIDGSTTCEVSVAASKKMVQLLELLGYQVTIEENNTIVSWS